jgi:hypothetical protein
MYNDIMRLIGDPQNATQLLIQDAGTRDLVIRRLYTDNNKAINEIDELIDSFEIDILPTELDSILGWVIDHVTYFLLSTGRMSAEVMSKYQEAGHKLSEAFSNLSKSGLDNSSLTSDSAGPSTSPPVEA